MSIYEQLGVEPIINASGSVTRLGGAPMPPEVLQAFHDAAADTVSLEALQAAASKRIAELTGTEAGLVTAGSAAALTLGAAAILCGHDLRRMEQLPHCDGFPYEFLVAREQRSGYDHAVRAAGVMLVEVGFNEIVAGAGVRRTEAWEYASAIDEYTAGILYVLSPTSQPPLQEVVEVAHAEGIPVLVDAAGELPPRSNLKAIAAAGADLVCFSGGKAIRGPQSTGILCGRRDLVASAALQMLDMDDHWDLWLPPADFIDKSQLPGLPRHGIGRGMKVSKEEIVALLTALDLFAAGEYDKLVPVYRGWLETIAAKLESAPADCRLIDSPDGERPPVLEISLCEPGSAFEVCRRLRQGSPPVYVGHGKLSAGLLVINPMCLREDQVERLADRLLAELS